MTANAAGATAGTSGMAAAAGGMAAAAGGMAAAAGGMAAAAGGMAAAAGGNASNAQSIQGCTGSTLLKLPDDTSVRGPWPIGSKTLKFGRFSAVELFYPAQPGSEQGKPEIEYDMREFLPEAERKKIPDADATIVKAKTFRDLPLDAAHGPYPVMIFVHGTARHRFDYARCPRRRYGRAAASS
jgi:hypothetical protein